MKKQFDILERLYKMQIEANKKASELQKVVDEEFNKLKSELLNLYDDKIGVLFLVKFGSFGITFYKATKDKLNELVLTWYNDNTNHKIPNNFDEAKGILDNYKNPTNCEIRSYQEFGYFHDIEKRFDRIDWITECIQNREFLYEIKKEDFDKAIKAISDFYIKN